MVTWTNPMLYQKERFKPNLKIREGVCLPNPDFKLVSQNWGLKAERAERKIEAPDIPSIYVPTLNYGHELYPNETADISGGNELFGKGDWALP